MKSSHLCCLVLASQPACRIPSRLCARHRYACATSLFAVVLWTLWTLGLLDHLHERSFSEFRWPPYENVREQVRLELSGERSARPYENDWAYFKPVLEPECIFNDATTKLTDKFLLIVVKSAATNVENRDAIRRTWGAVTSHEGFTIRTVFLVGRLPGREERKLEDVLAAEARDKRDLLIGNFTDAYHNNTYKFLFAIQYAHSYCSTLETVPFAFFVDDDYFVSIANLVGEVRERRQLERLYMGWRLDNTPFRCSFFRHQVPLEAYPFDRYPPYITGGAVLFSQQTIREMYHAIQHTRLYRYDDVYAGILAYLLALPVTHNPRMAFKSFRSLNVENAKTLICLHGLTASSLLKKYQELRKAGIVV